MNVIFKTNRTFKPKLFSEKLTALRTELKLTKKDVAAKLGFGRLVYMKIENGRYSSLKTSFVLLLADFYGVNPGYLIDDREPVKPRGKKCVFQKLRKLTQENKKKAAEYIDKLYEKEQQRINAPTNEYL